MVNDLLQCLSFCSQIANPVDTCPFISYYCLVKLLIGKKNMIGKAIRVIREFSELNQTELSEKAGISKSYMSEIENGKKLPNLELLDKFSEVLDVPVSSIMFFSEKLDGEGKLAYNFRSGFGSKIIKVAEWLLAQNNGKNRQIDEKEIAFMRSHTGFTKIDTKATSKDGE